MLLGSRAPRLRTVPAYERTYGQDVRDLAALAGLQLDPWQGDVLDDFCAVSIADPRRWNALECVEIVSRQNGKGGNLEAYVLGCLFLFDDELVMYSAHRFATAREMFLRIKELITGSDYLRRRVKRVSEAHGKEGIELLTGQRLLFYARSDKQGRGFSGHKNILDEAFLLDAATMGAIMPTMSAIPNPQIVYASSAGWEISEQLGKLRHRALMSICARLQGEGQDAEEIASVLGLAVPVVGRYLGKSSGVDPSLAFLEWSAPDNTPRVKGALRDAALLAQANPALGIRITEEFALAELRTMGAVEYARERLGVSDYPPDEEDKGGWEVVTEQDWRKLAIASDSEPPRPGRKGPQRVAFAVDMRPDGSAASIGAAFRDTTGALVVEVIEHETGSGWVVPRLAELEARYKPCAVAIDKRGPAASLISDAKNAVKRLLLLDTSEVAEAYGQIHRAITDTRDLQHLDQEPLNDAVKDATTRPLGDRLTWDRRGDADICPLVAVTNAAYAHSRTVNKKSDPLSNIW